MKYVPTWENTVHLILKSKIKGLAEQVRLDRLAKKNGKRRSVYVANSLSHEIRNHLLAYGILRGIPYHSIEAKRRVKPSAQQILEIIHQATPKYYRSRWTLQLIETILDVEPVPVKQNNAA